MAMAAGLHIGVEAQRLVAQPPLNHFFQTNKCPAAKEQNVCRVDREELLMRMLASALRWNVGNRAFEDLQQRLLHAFPRDVACDRWVLILTTDLVDLVDVDDALLRAFDVAVRGL